MAPHLRAPNGHYHSAAGEAKRKAVNDGAGLRRDSTPVIDFDRIIRAPAIRSAYYPAYDSDNHLHPGDARYGAIAAAIDPSLLVVQ
jgi:hypothetical protein